MTSIIVINDKIMENLIKQRHSVRAFLPQPIDSKIIHSILDIARFALSGTNTQPWKVYVVSGKTRDRRQILMTITKLFLIIHSNGFHLLLNDVVKMVGVCMDYWV